jgi:hypothetical protein
MEHTAVPMEDMVNTDEMGGSGFVEPPERYVALCCAVLRCVAHRLS